MKIHVIATGKFGGEAANRCADLVRRDGHVVRIDHYDGTRVGHESGWPHAELRVLFAWRETPELMERIDRQCAETGIPYTVAVLTHPRLRIGPTIIPATAQLPAREAGCFKCYESRRLQHGALDARSVPLYEHYDKDPAAGPTGYLPHHAGLAAAAVARVAMQLQEENLAAVQNMELSYNLLTNGLHQAELVPVHGCPRCGRRDLDASWSQLAKELPALEPELENSHG